MIEKQKFDAGYRYAQQENGALAGVIGDPPDPGTLGKDPEWQRGYARFGEEREQSP